MRRILVATLTALTVVIGLSAVLVGTASASAATLTPVPTALSCDVAKDRLDRAKADLAANTSDPGDLLRAAVNEAQKAFDNCTTTPSSTSNPGAKSCRDYNREGIYNIPRGDSRYRDFLDRDGDGFACENGEGSNGGNNGGPIYNGPRYNSCQEYGTHNMRDFRRGDSRWNDSWDRNRNGIACDQGDVIVSNDGECITIREGVRNYGTRYNDTYRDRLNRAQSINSDGGRSITDRERRDLLDSADLRDYRNRYNTDLGRLRTVCQDNNPPVVIVNEAPPAPSVTVTQAPPPPAAGNPAPYGSSGGQVSKVPSGAAQTGDGSTQL